jgi:acetyl-CoA carboxylase carboxyltransferase component
VSYDALIEEYAARRAKALAMGGAEKIARRREEGLLNARERIDYLVDPDSFLESGLFGTSIRTEVKDKTPADGKITGLGRINGRKTAIVSDDFTVMGASNSDTNARKIQHIRQVAEQRGLSMVYLCESAAARMPDAMGSAGIARKDAPTQFLRTRETPWAAAVLGKCYGLSLWNVCMSDFVAMRKGATMSVSSPRITSMAIGEEIDAETLGGWRLHTESTGLVDVAVDTDQEALDAIKRFLSYLPNHQNERPPVHPVPPGSDEAVKQILDILPESRAQVYDVRKIVRAIVDTGSMLELKPRYGKSVLTALARINGKTVGIVANNPLFKGGAVDVDACQKVTGFFVLCDSFNVPLVLMADVPGFLVGLETERKGAPGKIVNWMNALSLCTVPKIGIVMRKGYGQAIVNMGGSGNAHEFVLWFTGELSLMDPRTAASAVHGVKEADEPDRFRQVVEDMTKATSPYERASSYTTHAVLDPRETRSYLTQVLDYYESELTNGVSKHRLSNWPTSY